MEATIAAIPREGDVPAYQEEIDLIGRTAAGDHEAFGRLYAMHAPRVYRYLCRRLGDPALAEDVLHDVFIICLRKSAAYKPHRGVPFHHWLLRIATNAANNELRRRKRRCDSETNLMPGASPDQQLANHELIRAIQTLPPAQQSVLLLHYVEDLAIDHVAAVLGCRAGTVKSRLHRARANLRNALKRMENGYVT